MEQRSQIITSLTKLVDHPTPQLLVPSSNQTSSMSPPSQPLPQLNDPPQPSQFQPNFSHRANCLLLFQWNFHLNPNSLISLLHQSNFPPSAFCHLCLCLCLPPLFVICLSLVCHHQANFSLPCRLHQANLYLLHLYQANPCLSGHNQANFSLPCQLHQANLYLLHLYQANHCPCQVSTKPTSACHVGSCKPTSICYISTKPTTAPVKSPQANFSLPCRLWQANLYLLHLYQANHCLSSLHQANFSLPCLAPSSQLYLLHLYQANHCLSSHHQANHIFLLCQQPSLKRLAVALARHSIFGTYV